MPPFLFSLLLNKYVWFAVALGVVTAWGGYHRWQHHRWEDRYEAYRVEVAAIGLAAKKAAEEKTAQQKETTKEVRLNVQKSRARIESYYSLRLPKPATSGGAVSSAPVDSGRTDAPASEPVASGPGFERACALDADQVMAFQEWVRKQGIPVE